MAATLTTTTNVTEPVNFILMKALLSAARKKLPFFNGTLPGELMATGNASYHVKWRRIENLTAVTTALGEPSGTAAAFLGRDAVQPTITDVTQAMLKYGNLVLTTENVDLFNVNSNSVALMDTLGANAGESLNRLAEAEYSNSTQIRYSGTGASSDSTVASALTLNDVKFCVNKLNRNSAMKFTSAGYGSTNIGTSPVRSSFYGIAHPDVEEDIRTFSGFIPVEQYGGYTQTEPFEFGAAGGVRWCSTEIIPISTGIGAVTAAGLRGGNAQGVSNDIYSTYIYGKESVGSVGLGNMHATSSYEMYDPKKPNAVQLIFHKAGSSGVFDPYNEINSLAWKAWLAMKILNANWIIKCRSGATAL